MYCILDLETTGLIEDGKFPKIIEVGIRRVPEDGGYEDFISLVNPEMPIPQTATEINHITDDMVKDAPTISALKEKIEDFIKGSQFIVGHNIIAFDAPILRNENISLNMPLKDTRGMAKSILKGKFDGSFSLENLGRHFHLIDESEKEKHRAIDDVALCQMLYDRLTGDEKESVSDMNRIIENEKGNKYILRLSKELTAKLVAVHKISSSDLSSKDDFEIREMLKSEYASLSSKSLADLRKLLSSFYKTEETKTEDGKTQEPENEKPLDKSEKEM